MATDDPYTLTLATRPIGFKTLFVNSKETQILPYKYGLSLQHDIARADSFFASINLGDTSTLTPNNVAPFFLECFALGV